MELLLNLLYSSKKNSIVLYDILEKKLVQTIEIDQIIHSCYHEICYRNVPHILLNSVEYNRTVMQIKQFSA